ncbi:MAG: beta-propeller fold lactonase family protein [Verrucomicrobia bacterium]|nr:beta-propeller fold lactonase family protein [Verrucomicrobiota bacterium]
MNANLKSLFGTAPIALLALSLSVISAPPAAAAQWLSPAALIASPDGDRLYIACTTADRVLIFDLATRKVMQSIATSAAPTGLALSADGNTLFVTCAAPESQVSVVDVAQARVTAKLAAGHTAMAPVLSPDGKTLFVCNRFNDDISVLDLATQKELRRIPVRREPVAAAITPDGKRLLVANHLHHGRADTDHVGAVVSVIDTALGQVVDDLWLPNGSGSLNDIRISPDGKYAVVTHVLSRFHLPTTQLDRGWMNTNAKTLIDLARMQVLNTVLLDTIDRGAANPWGAAWSADGKTLVVAIAGTHEVSVTDFPALLEKLAKVSSAAPASAAASLPYSNAASRVPSDVPNDLSFLVGVRERRRLPESDLGPRAVVVVGRHAYVANYFSDTLTVLELDGTHPKAETIPLGPKPQMTTERLGELYFHDARICFQGWQSCASCHPGDARVDALNWDLLNDGIGNPKNNKSLLLTFETPPSMSMGVRETPEAAVRAGIRHILFTVQPPEVGEAMDAYLKALKPVPSPRLVKGELSPAARRGEEVFRSKETACAQCHPGPLFTDLKTYDVGTLGRFDKPADLFDTPTLVEIWRTAPYLHDGSAATMRDVLTTANKNDQHGKTSHLTADQLSDLIEYLLSL